MSERLLLYDRDCGLCLSVVAGALILDRARRLRPVALQSAEAERVLPGMPPEQRLASFHLLDQATGQVSSAGAGLAELAAGLPGGRLTGSVLRAAPALNERAYRLVADNRHRLGRKIPSRVKAAARKRVERAEARR